MSRHLGLIIGVNTYQDSTFRPLHGAENDAKALAQWLVNTKGGKWSPPDVQLVQGEHATHKLVESLIARLCLQVAEAGDGILIYFAGHAFVDERSGEGYLALSNTRYQDPTSGISLRAFSQQILAQSRAAYVLFVLDCFQNGQVWSMRRTSPYDARPLLGSALSSLQQQQNRLMLCSCRGNEFAQETAENQLGTFAYRTILGLCGPASEPGTGNVTLTSLQTYLTNAVGEQQRPQLFGQQTVPLILIGELPEASEAQAAAPSIDTESTTGYIVPMGTVPATGGLLRKAAPFATTATQPPPASPGPSTSGHISTAALEEQRQQHCQQMLAQAQQLVQQQNYGEAFSLVEKVLQVAPNDLNALTLKAQLLGTAGRFPEALATVEQITQIDPTNALAWSMRGVLLSNMGQHAQALSAVERSLELDTHNPETYAIKTNIMAKLAAEQSRGGSRLSDKLGAVQRPQDNASTFLLALGLQLLGLIIGVAGPLVLIFTRLPIYAGFALASLGLAILCVNALVGAFRYGPVRLVLTTLISGLTAAILGAAYVLGSSRIFSDLRIHPTRLIPVLFLALWLAAAAGVPFILAIVGTIGGLLTRKKRPK